MLFKRREKNEEPALEVQSEAPVKKAPDNWDLIREAYIYSFPLINVYGTCLKMTNTVAATNKQAPFNQLIHARELATADDKDVVTPNVDTVYSQLCLDLEHEPVIFKKPASDRFMCVQVMDAFTNVVAMLGTGGDTDDECTYIFTSPFYRGAIPEGMTEIKMPTCLGWAIIRIVCSGQYDLPNVYALQKGMDSFTLSAYKNSTINNRPNGVYHESFNFIPLRWALGLSPVEYFETVNKLLSTNPAAPEDAPAIAKFGKIGVGAGLFFDPKVLGEDKDSKWVAMTRGLWEPIIADCTERFKIQNGVWQCFGDPVASFGTEYGYRALVTLEGLGANPTYIAMYPKAMEDISGKRLNGENRYLLHFAPNALPPTKEKGFWSITAYNSADSLLIPNRLGRYCINDRSDCIFAPDGSLDIWIAAIKPDNVPEENWLPVCDDEFHLFMRVYLPDESVLEGKWQAPIVVKT